LSKHIQFWKRELGALWNPFEKERIFEFSKIKSDEKICLSGYVKWVKPDLFVLLPTLFSNQIHLLCINKTSSQPPENSYITVSGTTRRHDLRRKNNCSTIFEGQIIVDVEDWKVSKPNFKLPKEETKYTDFKSNLTRRVEGLEPKIEDFLAFTAISTPPMGGFSGGVNATLYDSTQSGIPKKVIKEIREAFPKGMGKICSIKTSYGKVGLRYGYNYFVGDADKPISPLAEKFLTHNISNFNETSFSLHSKNSKPISIQDPPCSLTDIPTVTPENTSIKKGAFEIDQYDALQYLMVSHLKTPIIIDLDKSIDVVVKGLKELVSSWGLPPEQISRYGFLDANYNARPSSVLRQCLALARAKNVEVVNSDFTRKVFDDYFKWNFEYVYELWDDLLNKPILGKQTLLSLRVKYPQSLGTSYSSIFSLSVSTTINPCL